MKILVKKTILHYTEKYPIAKMQLLIWYNEFTKYDFRNFNELKRVYGNASMDMQTIMTVLVKPHICY